MKLSTGLENFKGVVSDDLSFSAVEIDKNYWLALPQWRNLRHWLSCDQPQPGSFFQRPREAEKRDPGNEVGPFSAIPPYPYPLAKKGLILRLIYLQKHRSLISVSGLSDPKTTALTPFSFRLETWYFFKEIKGKIKRQTASTTQVFFHHVGKRPTQMAYNVTLSRDHPM